MLLIRTLDELIAWFEENFSCVVGWPMFCTGEGEPPTVDEMNARHSSEWSGTTRYIAYGLNGDPENNDRYRLMNALYIVFNRKLKRLPEIRGTRLYWRYPQKIEVDDGRIYMRIAIPALAGRTDGLPVHEEGQPLRSIYLDSEVH